MSCSCPCVLQRPGDSCQILGSRIPPAQKESQNHCLSLQVSSLFSFNCPLHLLHTLHFTQISFSNLVCVCPAPRLSWPGNCAFFPQGEHADFLFEICLEHGSKNPPLSFHIQGTSRGRKVLHSLLVAKGIREYFCQPSTLGEIFYFFCCCTAGHGTCEFISVFNH